jgi:transcription elongation factor GreA
MTKLSQAAFDRLQTELDDLTTRGRVEIARKIEEARALGDLSENGDYHAAKDTQGHMESRIRQLQALLKDAEISEEIENPDIVAAGSIVTLRYVGDEEDEDYLVGSVEERREGLAVISTESPLGRALIGRRAGSEEVSFTGPSGRELAVVLRAVRAG